MNARSVPVILALTLVLSPARTWAEDVDESEARALFDAGTVAYDAGRYESALSRFQEAYELTHRSLILWNIALAADRARHDELALTTYRRFLDEVPDSPQVHDIRVRALARIDVLEQTVAQQQAAEEQSRQAELERRRAEAEAAQAAIERELAEQAEVEAQRARAEADRARADADRAHRSSRLVNKWWFWTLIGVGVAGAVAIPVAVASTHTTTSSFPSTDHGNVVFALTSRY